jgi:hypothetical protein
MISRMTIPVQAGQAVHIQQILGCASRGLLQDLGSRFPRLRHLFADSGYSGPLVGLLGPPTKFTTLNLQLVF